MQEIFLKYLEINMEEIKNRFYNTLDDDNKEKYKILFNKNLVNNRGQFNGFIADKKDGQCDISFSDKIDTESNSINFNQTLSDFLEKQKGNVEECKKKIEALNIKEFTPEKLKKILKEIHKYKDDDLGKIDKYIEENKSNDDVLHLVLDEYNIYDLSYMYFYKEIKFTKIISSYENISFANANFVYKTDFTNNAFKGYVSFEGAVFYQWANFNRCIFNKDCSFESSVFKAEVEFQKAKFKMNARFAISRFEKFSSFEEAIFSKEIDFENTIAKDLFYFHNVKLGKINLIGSHLDKANFLRLKNSNNNSRVLTKDNFSNKDSARIIKTHFEKENNITEANIYFVLEQEFFLDLLSKENSAYPNQTIDKVSLLFNKYVSNYGTDWVRVLIIMFGFGFSASLGYSFFDSPVKLFFCPYILKDYIVDFNLLERYILLLSVYYSFILYLLYDESSKENNSKGWCWFFLWLFVYIIVFMLSDVLQAVNNKTISLINPLNIFNQDIAILQNNTIHKNINYFETIALYGIFVKGVAVTLIYQFIISFRNSSRRK